MSVGLRELRFEIEDFNTAYVRALDAFDMDAWPKFFTEDGFYRITARENADAGLPVGLVWCDGQAMMRDRVMAVKATMVYAPRYLRHYTSNVTVTGAEGGAIESESNYLVVETLVEDETRIFMAGRYIDRFARDGSGALLLKSRDCIYDSLLIPNDVVYPI